MTDTKHLREAAEKASLPTQEQSDQCDEAYSIFVENHKGLTPVPWEAFRSGWFWRAALSDAAASGGVADANRRAGSLPFAVFDEFGKPADDRVQDWAYRLLAAPPQASPVAPVLNYTNQPGNVECWSLGEACRKAADDQKCGDCIDRGLILLRELQAKGFGVVKTAAGAELAAPPQASAPAAPDQSNRSSGAGDEREAMTEKDHLDFALWHKRLMELADEYHAAGSTSPARERARQSLRYHSLECATGWRARSVLREQQARAALAQPAGWQQVGEVTLFNGDLKGVSWLQRKLPPIGTKLYVTPASQAQPASAPLAAQPPQEA